MSAKPHPCGHEDLTPGCGGCDPSAIEFVIPDGEAIRRFDPALDLTGAQRDAAMRAQVCAARTQPQEDA